MPPLVATVAEKEPWTEAFVMTLLVAPLMNRIVEVPDVGEAVVFAMVSESPPALTPSIVTLSAPLKSIRGLPAVVPPEMVLASPPTAFTVIVV